MSLCSGPESLAKTGTVSTKLHFLRSLWTSPISNFVCHWQTFPA